MNNHLFQRRITDAAVKCRCQPLPALFRAGSGAQFLLLASAFLPFGSRGKETEGSRYCRVHLAKPAPAAAVLVRQSSGCQRAAIPSSGTEEKRTTPRRERYKRAPGAKLRNSAQQQRHAKCSKAGQCSLV